MQSAMDTFQKNVKDVEGGKSTYEADKGRTENSIRDCNVAPAGMMSIKSLFLPPSFTETCSSG